MNTQHTDNFELQDDPERTVGTDVTDTTNLGGAGLCRGAGRGDVAGDPEGGMMLDPADMLQASMCAALED